MNQDDIRIQHAPHNRSEHQAVAIQPQSERATSLPEDEEDVLRRLLSTVTALDVLSFVAATHLARRNRSRTLAGAIRRFAEDVRSYCGKPSGMNRATISAKWNATAQKIPELAVVRSWAKGHGGRKAANA